MSAIFGMLRWNGGDVASRDIERMGNTLSHRGPDGCKLALNGVVGLGHCLMRVNQEDLFEAQPLHDRKSDISLVADCRIDNREDLARVLGIGAAALRDMPDSGLILHAYLEWGDACVDRLLGDFAFAAWDGRRRALLLARDHMGQRCLFYHAGKDFIAFATEPKALWAVEGVPRALDTDNVGWRLLHGVDVPLSQTLFKEISVLPGGMTLKAQAGGAVKLDRYWDPHSGAEHAGRDDAYYLGAYREIVTEAVACRVRRLTRAPALRFSGGFDSGTIAALAGPIVTERNGKIIAVSSVLAEGHGRPVRDARKAVEAFRPFPYLAIRYFVRKDESIFSDLETSFAIMDDGAGTPYVQRGLLEIAAAAGARLMLDGHGGDYTVNVRAGDMLGRTLRRGRLGSFVRQFGLRVRKTGRSPFSVLRSDVLPALLPLGFLSALKSRRHGSRSAWSNMGVSAEFARDLFARRAVDPSRLRIGYPIYNRWRDRWLHMLRRFSALPPASAQFAAKYGMDVSRPFHDKRVVELGLALPERLQFKDGLERYLARRALADVLPARLLESGPGNDAEEPDLFRMASEAAPSALDDLRSRDRDGRLSRYVDLDKLEQMISGPQEGRKADQFRLSLATRAIAMARFVAWFERSNLH